MNTGSNSTRRYRLREDGILVIQFQEGARETAKSAREGIASVPDRMGKNKYPVLLDMRPLKSMDREARVLYAQNARRSEAAAGLLVDSAYSRTLAEFYVGAMGDALPTKIFEIEQDAIQWLKTFL